MKTGRILFVALLGVAFQQAALAKNDWGTDYEKAREEARTSHKLVLLNFTGSDWCGWCKLLDKEVFSTSQFQNYAQKNLVLVEVDFPRRKPQSESLKMQNQQLSDRYHIEGYPTLIVLNGDGKKVGELGYMEGGPSVFIAELEKLRKKS